MKKNAKIAATLLLALLFCSCQEAELHHVIVNTTDADLDIAYKLRVCNTKDYWGSWTPEMQNEEEFKSGGDTWISMREENYRLETGAENAESIDAANKARGKCDTMFYKVVVPPHAAVRIHKGDFREKRSLVLLELKGAKGNIKYEGSAPLIMNVFESYNNDRLNLFGHSLEVLWY